MAVLTANYPRIEARYTSVDLVHCSTRRALNLTEDWLLSVVSEDDWNDHFKEVLSETLEDNERLSDQEARWGDPDEDGRGEFVLQRKDDDAPSSNFNFSPA